jgi:hypothetical protein
MPIILQNPPTEQVPQAAGTSGPPPAAPPERAEGEGQSLSEINKQLSNPVTSLWSMSSQLNNYPLVNDQPNNKMQFQPVLPVSLIEDLNLITRPMVPLHNSVPVLTSPGTFDQKTGFGDMTLSEVLSPADAGP